MKKGQLLTFAAALADAVGGKKHVLLGNGFSIGAHDLFQYGALYEQAKKVGLPKRIDQLFDRYGTTNFEEVLKQLDEGAWLAGHYKLKATNPKLDMIADHARLKEILAEAIASVHPASRVEVPEGKLKACSGFLDKFHDVFTTNYDLLLYWASLVQEPFPFSDGFGREDDTGDDYVVFLQTSSDRRHIYFLHGALHLYAEEGEVRKMIWSNTGIPLIDQVKSALSAKRYPLVVSEGRSSDKASRIEMSGYLWHTWRRFENLEGSLFVYGSSLSAQDDHLLDAIAKDTGLPRLYVGIYGDPASDSNAKLIARANGIAEHRQKILISGKTGGHKKKGPLSVRFFDSSSVDVWGGA